MRCYLLQGELVLPSSTTLQNEAFHLPVKRYFYNNLKRML